MGCPSVRHVWILSLLVVAVAAAIGVVVISSNDDDQTSATAPIDDPSDATETPTSAPSTQTALVDVEQIPGDPRESVPSALDDMEDARIVRQRLKKPGRIYTSAQIERELGL